MRAVHPDQQKQTSEEHGLRCPCQTSRCIAVVTLACHAKWVSCCSSSLADLDETQGHKPRGTSQTQFSSWATRLDWYVSSRQTEAWPAAVTTTSPWFSSHAEGRNHCVAICGWFAWQTAYYLADEQMRWSALSTNSTATHAHTIAAGQAQTWQFREVHHAVWPSHAYIAHAPSPLGRNRGPDDLQM